MQWENDTTRQVEFVDLVLLVNTLLMVKLAGPAHQALLLRQQVFRDAVCVLREPGKMLDPALLVTHVPRVSREAPVTEAALNARRATLPKVLEVLIALAAKKGPGRATLDLQIV